MRNGDSLGCGSGGAGVWNRDLPGGRTGAQGVRSGGLPGDAGGRAWKFTWRHQGAGVEAYLEAGVEVSGLE